MRLSSVPFFNGQPNVFPALFSPRLKQDAERRASQVRDAELLGEKLAEVTEELVRVQTERAASTQGACQCAQCQRHRSRRASSVHGSGRSASSSRRTTRASDMLEETGGPPLSSAPQSRRSTRVSEPAVSEAGDNARSTLPVASDSPFRYVLLKQQTPQPCRGRVCSAACATLGLFLRPG